MAFSQPESLAKDGKADAPEEAVEDEEGEGEEEKGEKEGKHAHASMHE